jgi:hypothetical protein
MQDPSVGPKARGLQQTAPVWIGHGLRSRDGADWGAEQPMETIMRKKLRAIGTLIAALGLVLGATALTSASTARAAAGRSSTCPSTSSTNNDIHGSRRGDHRDGHTHGGAEWRARRRSGATRAHSPSTPGGISCRPHDHGRAPSR